MTTSRNCKHCGAEFSAHRNQQLYCSKRCRRRHKEEVSRKQAAEHAGCVDCGVNTSEIREDYIVEEEVWALANLQSGCLCIGCLEQRIGRTLCSDDFMDSPFNWDNYAHRRTSSRLRARMDAAGRAGCRRWRICERKHVELLRTLIEDELDFDHKRLFPRWADELLKPLNTTLPDVKGECLEEVLKIGFWNTYAEAARDIVIVVDAAGGRSILRRKGEAL